MFYGLFLCFYLLIISNNIKLPFIGFKLTKKEVERPCLTKHELEEIASKEFKTERLTLVQDILFLAVTPARLIQMLRSLNERKLL